MASLMSIGHRFARLCRAYAIDMQSRSVQLPSSSRPEMVSSLPEARARRLRLLAHASAHYGAPTPQVRFESWLVTLGLPPPPLLDVFPTAQSNRRQSKADTSRSSEISPELTPACAGACFLAAAACQATSLEDWIFGGSTRAAVSTRAAHGAGTMPTGAPDERSQPEERSQPDGFASSAATRRTERECECLRSLSSLPSLSERLAVLPVSSMTGAGQPPHPDLVRGLGGFGCLECSPRALAQV